MRQLLLAILTIGLIGLLGCAPDEETPDEAEAELASYDVFWSNLTVQCGSAYEGEVTDKPEGDDQISEDAELIMHFRECEEDELRLPLHVREPDMDDWDRSRTWVLMPHEEGLELRHDHRNPDGTEEENTWYGAVTLGESDGSVAEFISQGRDGEDVQSGWRIEIEPGERYTYGTIRDGEWRYRLNFDLTEPLEEPPPAPWGFEDDA